MFSFINSVLSGILLLICGVLAAPIMCALFIAFWIGITFLLLMLVTGVEHIVYLIRNNTN